MPYLSVNLLQLIRTGRYKLVVPDFQMSHWGFMMTSSNGNIFRVTGPLCGNSLVTAEFPSQRPVMWSFGVFFDPCLNKWLSKQSWGWWFETPSRSLWRHCNVHWMTGYQDNSPPAAGWHTLLQYQSLLPDAVVIQHLSHWCGFLTLRPTEA